MMVSAPELLAAAHETVRAHLEKLKGDGIRRRSRPTTIGAGDSAT